MKKVTFDTYTMRNGDKSAVDSIEVQTVDAAMKLFDDYDIVRDWKRELLCSSCRQGMKNKVFAAEVNVYDEDADEIETVAYKQYGCSEYKESEDSEC